MAEDGEVLVAVVEAGGEESEAGAGLAGVAVGEEGDLMGLGGGFLEWFFVVVRGGEDLE